MMGILHWSSKRCSSPVLLGQSVVRGYPERIIFELSFHVWNCMESNIKDGSIICLNPLYNILNFVAYKCINIKQYGNWKPENRNSLHIINIIKRLMNFLNKCVGKIGLPQNKSKSKNKDYQQPYQGQKLSSPPLIPQYNANPSYHQQINQETTFQNQNTEQGGFFLGGDQVSYNSQPQSVYPRYGQTANVAQQSYTYNQGSFPTPITPMQNYNNPISTNEENNWRNSPIPQVIQQQPFREQPFREQPNNFSYQQNYNPQQQSAQKKNSDDSAQIFNDVGWIGQNLNTKDGNVIFLQQVGQSKLQQFVMKEQEDTNHARHYNVNSNNIWTEALKTVPANINSNFQRLGQMGGGYNRSVPFCLTEVKSKQPSPFIKYKIIPLKDEKKTLDVVSVNNKSKGLYKNNMTIWDYHGGPNQLFYFARCQSGTQEERNAYYIFNIARGFVVQIPGTLAPPNYQQGKLEPVVAMPRTPDAILRTQLWALQESGYGSYVIRSLSNGKVLDLYHTRSDNGTPVIHWDCSSQPASNQKWRIVPA